MRSLDHLKASKKLITAWKREPAVPLLFSLRPSTLSGNHSFDPWLVQCELQPIRTTYTLLKCRRNCSSWILVRLLQISFSPSESKSNYQYEYSQKLALLHFPWLRWAICFHAWLPLNTVWYAQNLSAIRSFSRSFVPRPYRFRRTSSKTRPGDQYLDSDGGEVTRFDNDAEYYK